MLLSLLLLEKSQQVFSRLDLVMLFVIGSLLPVCIGIIDINIVAVDTASNDKIVF